jgi:hypothetical protein
MGKSVTDVTHAAQNDINADKPAERADDNRCDEAVAKKFVFKWIEQRHSVQTVQKVQTVQAVFRRFERLERLERFERFLTKYAAREAVRRS